MTKSFNLISLIILSITSVLAQDNSYSTNLNRSNTEAAPAYSQNYGKSSVAPDTDDCEDSVDAVPAAYDVNDKAPVDQPSTVNTTPTNNNQVAPIELEAEDCPDSEEEGKGGNGNNMPDMTKYESNHIVPSYDQTLPIHNHATPSDCESESPETEVTPTSVAPEVETTPTSLAPDVEATPTSLAPEVDATPTSTVPEAEVTSTSVAPEVEETPTSVSPIIEVPSSTVTPDVESPSESVAQFGDSTTTSCTDEAIKSSMSVPTDVSPYVAAIPSAVSPYVAAIPSAVSSYFAAIPSAVSPYVAAIPKEVSPYAAPISSYLAAHVFPTSSYVAAYVAPTSSYVAPYVAPTSSYVAPYVAPTSSNVSPNSLTRYPSSSSPIVPSDCLTGECKVRYELVAIDDCTDKTLSRIPLPHSVHNFQNLLDRVDPDNESGIMSTQVEPYDED